jgi:hypothetical protein
VIMERADTKALIPQTPLRPRPAVVNGKHQPVEEHLLTSPPEREVSRQLVASSNTHALEPCYETTIRF